MLFNLRRKPQPTTMSFDSQISQQRFRNSSQSYWPTFENEKINTQFSVSNKREQATWPLSTLKSSKRQRHFKNQKKEYKKTGSGEINSRRNDTNVSISRIMNPNANPYEPKWVIPANRVELSKTNDCMYYSAGQQKRKFFSHQYTGCAQNISKIHTD